ncbi:hypothetical protein GCK72_016960 [Caenorhabditis remanei]|uniref:Protein kinase domain-containing protein n=1 Tax=Caenorhabditis remanei TaxID=31234 RepID=A0A6A5G5Z6_CAERE|nr:hypothetical protein GCK72_016960 [Caenorhabditis remanei]KAF1750410.1 hypothetical protein GCK72_016960 [Caenorhabditis remanei]
MDDDDDKPDRQVESIRLELNEEVMDKDEQKNVWVAQRMLGKGAFGTVYHVYNKSTKQEAALKIERMTAGDNLLKIEREIMEAMQSEKTAIHIFDNGIYNNYRFIVMTLCGPDLQKIAELMNNKFSDETVIRVSIRTLLAIKTMHEFEYVHRDLKPCNFAVDYNPNALHIYLFDYGMARRYARHFNNKWYLRRPRESAQFRGTNRYCSLNMHKRKELGRVDDVWSWFFMMMEMHRELPWHNLMNVEAIEARKEEQLHKVVSTDPFYSSFLPIYAMLSGYEYADRPDYAGIFEILLRKLREINGKLSGPMEYDAARINEAVAKLGENGRPKVVSKMEDEMSHLNFLKTAFYKVVIPGGNQYVIPEMVDFFGNLEPKKAKEEKTDEHKKQHRQQHRAMVPVVNKMTHNPHNKKKQQQQSSGDGNTNRKSVTIGSKSKTNISRSKVAKRHH